MTNEEKYKTPEERVKAFEKWCLDNQGKPSCDNCIGERDMRFSKTECFAHWLALEAEEEKPMPCPYCGGKTSAGDSPGTSACAIAASSESTRRSATSAARGIANSTSERRCPMLNNNETVAEIICEMYDSGIITNIKMHRFANRIRAAHEREVTGLVANLDALEKAIVRVCSLDEIAEIIAVKTEIQNGNR